ncbi:MAG: hypothetical protein R3320_01280 [Nitriliruptorales bacterium]|nr:hypothetical protein [Nitriliruptorales bacterium]
MIARLVERLRRRRNTLYLVTLYTEEATVPVDVRVKELVAA